jgi:hypothetical protein
MGESHFVNNLHYKFQSVSPDRKCVSHKQNILFDARMFLFPQKAMEYFLNYQLEEKKKTIFFKQRDRV